ncbi:MAG: HAD-IA family hydrolase, partial [Candidatus Bathyarchaeota archaeon]|nr:HAD-IA family hydrolase [Candidatus Bathyarchaeota archaeon]
MVVVLFDLEGTLVQTIEDDQEAVDELRTRTKEKLIELGIPGSELEGLVGTTLMRNRALGYVKENFNEEETKQFHLELDKFMKHYELSWAENSKIFRNTLPALRELKRLECRMGIVTNTSTEAASCELSMHEIDAFFEAVITRDDVIKLKPDTEGIRIALKRLNAQDFFFVGDLIHDSSAAEKAGGTSIIINRHPSTELEFHADHVIKSLMEVPSLIQRVADKGDNVLKAQVMRIERRWKRRFHVVEDRLRLRENVLNSKRHLDFGCGFGTFAKILAEKYPYVEVYGIDVDKEKIETGKRRYSLPNLHLINSNKIVGKYDSITAIFVLHEIANIKQTLDALYEHLSKNGTIMIYDFRKRSKAKYREWFVTGRLGRDFEEEYRKHNR